MLTIATSERPFFNVAWNLTAYEKVKRKTGHFTESAEKSYAKASFCSLSIC